MSFADCISQNGRRSKYSIAPDNSVGCVAGEGHESGFSVAIYGYVPSHLYRGNNMSIFDILRQDSSVSPAMNQSQQPAEQDSDGPGCGTILGIGGLAALAGILLPKKVVKGAALMGLGAVAYNFYKKWSSGNTESDGGQPSGEARPYSGQDQARRGGSYPGGHQFGDMSAQTVDTADPAAILMLRAMVYSARADGHIDEQEKDRIMKIAEQFLPGADTRSLIQSFMNEPLDIGTLVSGIDSPDQREDLFRLSCLVIDIDHFMERSYIDALASALAITKTRQAELEQEVQAVKAQVDSAR